MTNFMIRVLTLVGTGKNYVITFKEGLNYISGHTSTGKTSILEMIDYSLGSSTHKSYIEIGNNCTDVQLEISIGLEKYKITRKLFNFTAAVVIEAWNEEKSKYLFFNRFEIDGPSNPNSLSSFLIEKIGLPNITIMGQPFSFRDLLKYSYLKQTEIDNENILGEQDWAKNLKRKGTFEIIFNIYDDFLDSLKRKQKDEEEELAKLLLKLEGVNEFLTKTSLPDIAEYERCKKEIDQKSLQLKEELNELKRTGRISNDITENLRKHIIKYKEQLQILSEKEYTQQQYINKLKLLSGQYQSDIEKKQMTIDGFIAFNQYDFILCPNCLHPINSNHDIEQCCLCRNNVSDNVDEILTLKNELSKLKRKLNELVRFIEKEENNLLSIFGQEDETRTKLSEYEIEIEHLYSNYENPHIERIEQLNYEIGMVNRQLTELNKSLEMLVEIDRLNKLIDSKKTSIENIKSNIKISKENSIDKVDVIKHLTHTYNDILAAFKFPKLSAAYIDENKYLPYIRDRKYNDIGSLAGVSLVTMAYYLAILVESYGNDYNHLNFLMIDSPRKNLGAKADDVDFIDEEIFNAIIQYLLNIEDKYNNKIQIIIVNNGYPDFLPREFIIAEFDAHDDKLPNGLIDDVT